MNKKQMKNNQVAICNGGAKSDRSPRASVPVSVSENVFGYRYRYVFGYMYRYVFGYMYRYVFGYRYRYVFGYRCPRDVNRPSAIRTGRCE